MLGGNTPQMQNSDAQHLPAMMLCSSSAAMIFFFQLNSSEAFMNSIEKIKYDVNKNKNLILERLRSSLNTNCSRFPKIRSSVKIRTVIITHSDSKSQASPPRHLSSTTLKTNTDTTEKKSKTRNLLMEAV